MSRFLTPLLAGWMLAAAAVPEAAAQIGPEVAGLAGRPVARIDLAGNKVTRDYVIRRELHTAVGDSLDPAVLAQDYMRLENLGVFGSIRVTAADSLGLAVVTFTVTEIPWLVPYPALSYNELDGWSIGLGVASPNLTGRVITLSGSLMFGGTTQYSAGFFYPWIAGNHLSASMALANLTRDDELNGFREQSEEFSPGMGTWVGTHGRLDVGLTWFQMNSETGGITLDPDGTDNLYRLGAGGQVDTRDSWRDPRTGWHNEARVAYTGLGGDGDYWTGILDVRRYQAGFFDHDVLAGLLVEANSGAVGTTFPSYLQYRLGGANSVRGFKAAELGAEQFGKNEFLATLEYEVPLSGLREYRILGTSLSLGFKLALFADAGLAWSDPDDAAWPRVQSGFGAGVRMLVPAVEMVRFEVAASRTGVEFHFAAQSKLAAQRQRLR